MCREGFQRLLGPGEGGGGVPESMKPDGGCEVGDLVEWNRGKGDGKDLLKREKKSTQPKGSGGRR